MSGLFDALWDDEMLKGYTKAHLEFYNRLVLKHKEKGYSFLDMSDIDLLDVTREEFKEVEGAIFNGTTQPDFHNLIEEGADLMICGLMLIAWAQHWKPKEG